MIGCKKRKKKKNPGERIERSNVIRNHIPDRATPRCRSFVNDLFPSYLLRKMNPLLLSRSITVIVGIVCGIVGVLSGNTILSRNLHSCGNKPLWLVLQR
jgi:hypothetical protein